MQVQSQKEKEKPHQKNEENVDMMAENIDLGECPDLEGFGFEPTGQLHPESTS